eukprot:Pgem_evm1s11788
MNLCMSYNNIGFVISTTLYNHSTFITTNFNDDELHKASLSKGSKRSTSDRQETDESDSSSSSKGKKPKKKAAERQ